VKELTGFLNSFPLNVSGRQEFIAFHRNDEEILNYPGMRDCVAMSLIKGIVPAFRRLKISGFPGLAKG
jgi:hypothetical protein